MSFEVGRLSAALTLDGVQQFHQDLDGVGRKLTETGQRGASFGRAAEAAVRTAAGATTGLVTAATAYVGILAKTGVGYNSLQQNSRAALNVLLGGAEKANAQMARLDDFARNSPFSKSVFIEAQQQLLGFGMEAGKVVPTLDAIQQGVAAMGGSNEQISEVVNILANVQSTGKITAETFNQLGYRGLDAAQLIGDSMGKTAAQVREDVSDAALDGRKAIDLLVDGMQNRFGGAADGVKEQWSGAVDRIKAAQRDLGAHIAEPFVSAQGGGMAVTWGNQVADVLRAIEKQAVPVMSILTERGMPFFSGLTQGLDSAAQSIARWDASSLEVSLDKMAGHAPGIAALSGAVLALGANVGPLGQILRTVGISANPLLGALVGLAAASPEVRTALGDLLAAGKPLVPVLGDLASALSGTLNAALPVASDGIRLLATLLRPAVALIDAIPAPVLAGAAAFLAFRRATQSLNAPLTAVSTALLQFAQRAQVQAHLGGTTNAVGALSTASMGAQGAVRGLGNALKTAFLSNPIGLALTAVSMAIGAWASANAAAQQKVQEHQARVAELKGTLDETSGALSTASKDMVGQVTATDEMAEALQKSGISSQAFVLGITEGGRAATSFESSVMSSAKSMEAYDKYSGNWQQTADQLGVSLDTLVRSSLGFTDAQDEVNEAVSRSGGSYSELGRALDSTERGIQRNLSSQYEVVSAYEAQRLALEEAQREQARMREASREAAAAMTEASRSNERFNDAMAVARDTTQDMETRVRSLKQALDELSGGELTAEQAQIRLARTAESLAEGFARTDEAGNSLWGSLLDASGGFEINSSAAADLAEQMGFARDGMLGAATEAADLALANGDVAGAVQAATDAGNDYIETLRQTMSDAGLTEGQIEGLIGRYLDVPDVVATALAADGLDEAELKVVSLLAQLSELEEGETIEINLEGNEEAIAQLEELGYKVEESSDGKTVEITSQGFEQVLSDLEAINGLWMPEKIVEIDADAADAFAGIEGVEVVQISDKTAMVYGDNKAAISEIDKVIAKGIPGKWSVIDANTAAFYAAWSNIESLQTIRKTIEIAVNAVTSIAKGPDSATGNMFNGGDVQAFATGGMPSGFYKAPPGQAAIHKFAERELPWEAYISPKPGYRQRNINIAMESLRRLAFPVIPASQVRGIPAFANGGMPGREAPTSAPSTAPPVRVERRRRRGRNAPLAETINLGVDATTNDLRTLSDVLDRLRRER